MSFTTEYLAEAALVISRLDPVAIEKSVQKLAEVRQRGGRLFFLGVGGSAANASHACHASDCLGRTEETIYHPGQRP